LELTGFALTLELCTCKTKKTKKERNRERIRGKGESKELVTIQTTKGAQKMSNKESVNRGNFR